MDPPIKFAPLDNEGFVQSFSLDQEHDILNFFDEYGFVIINNILSEEDTNASINDIWELIEESRKLDPISRDDPTTWLYWAGLEELGILSQSLSLQGWKNRVNPRLYQAFKLVLKEDKLWVSVDNWGVLRPTKDVPTVALPPTKFRKNVEYDGPEKEDKPKWITNSKWLHWDLNPYDLDSDVGEDYQFEGDFTAENNGTKISSDKVKVQGLLNLIDAREQDGGFLTVPGFYKHIKEWRVQEHLKPFEKKYKDERYFVTVPEDDPMQKHLQKVSMRAGALLIWNGLQPHCNYSNSSNRFRMVQYVKMFEAHPNAKGVSYRTGLMQKHVPLELQDDDTHLKLFGVQKY